MTTRKDTKQMVERALARGWELSRITGTGHIQLRWCGGGKVTFSSTPTSGRGLLNAQSEMRRVERMNPVARP